MKAKKETRIKLTDTTIDVVTKMSNGNPGAAMALLEVLSNSENIDPDGSLGGVGAILLLDTFGIYGTDIYVLYSDICNKDLVKMLAVLRASQLGIFSSSILKDACNRQDYSGKAMVPVDELYIKVKEILPNFNSN